jgi:hypothetical protein
MRRRGSPLWGRSRCPLSGSSLASIVAIAGEGKEGWIGPPLRLLSSPITRSSPPAVVGLGQRSRSCGYYALPGAPRPRQGALNRVGRSCSSLHRVEAGGRWRKAAPVWHTPQLSAPPSLGGDPTRCEVEANHPEVLSTGHILKCTVEADVNPRRPMWRRTLSYLLLTVKFRQPSLEFTFGDGMTFVSYPLVLTPVV